MEAIYPSMNSLGNIHKLIWYMSQENNEIINTVTIYVYNYFQEREMCIKTERKAGSGHNF